MARAENMCRGERLHREGKLPKRVCHCDTKVDNILFDQNDNVLCVIDLDTVMPSFIFSDYGDFLRSAANFVAEDCPEIDKVGFNMEVFKAFTKGYLKTASKFLTPIEIENLPYAATLFPYMQVVRFYADYLNGDTYFKTQYPEHNLVRTKNQLALLESAEKHLPEMEAFIKEQLAKDAVVISASNGFSCVTSASSADSASTVSSAAVSASASSTEYFMFSVTVSVSPFWAETADSPPQLRINS